MVSRTALPTTPVIFARNGLPGGIIWVFAGGFLHNGKPLFTWRPPGVDEIHPASICGFIPASYPQDGLIITGHMMPSSSAEPNNERDFHAEVTNQIAALKRAMGPDTPVILVGFSEGGIELSATAQFLANENGGSWDRQALVLVSAPYSAEYLHQPQRALVQSSVRFNPALGGGLSHRLGKMLAQGEIKALRAGWTGDPEDLDLLVQLIERSAADTPEVLQNAQVIALSRGFGPRQDRSGDHVIAINLHEARDKVVKVGDNLRATARTYPGVHNLFVAAQNHGFLFADAALYRHLLAAPAPHQSIRGNFAHIWGLAA